MSNFPVWWGDTITIYNRYEDPQTNLITWTNTVIPGCFFKNTNNKVTVGQTVIESDNVVVRIPENANYKPYVEWIALGNDVRPGYFTLHTGDIIILGQISDTIDEYDKTKNSNAFLSKYKNLSECLVIDTFADNTRVGRGLKHYRVIGT